MNYLEPSYYFDFESKQIEELTSEFKSENLTAREKAIGAYTKVRDNWRYDPYHISFAKENYQSSHIATKPSGNCVEKSILLVSCLRGLRIPARLHLAKVKNHIAIERLTEKFGTNELTPHGMVNAFLDGKWLKMSPAFNKSLCERLHVEPLEFDGKNDSYLQQFNSEGTKFMEYLDDYGHFEDVPLEFMLLNLKENYPDIFKNMDSLKEIRL